MVENTIKRIENLKKQIIQQNNTYQQLLQESKQLENQIRELDANINQVYPTYQALYSRETNLNAWKNQIENMKYSILDESTKIEPMRKKLKVLVMNDLYGEITTKNLNDKIEEASNILVKLDGETAELNKKRESIIESYKECKSEISAIQNDVTPMKMQTEQMIRKTRNSNRAIQQEMEELKIKNLKDSIKYCSESLSEDAKAFEARLSHAKNQVEILYQSDVTNALTQALYLITQEVQSNVDLHMKTRDEFVKSIPHLEGLLPLSKEQDEMIDHSNDITKTIIQDRNNIISQINMLIGEIEKLSVLKNKTIEEIDNCQTEIDIKTFEQKKIKEQHTQLHQQNNKLQKEIKDKIETIEEQKKYISQIEEENKRIENYSSITKENIVENKANLKNLKKEEIEIRNKYIESQKSLERKANEFLKSISLFKNIPYNKPEFNEKIDKMYKEIDEKTSAITKQLYNTENEYKSSQDQLQYQLSFAHYILFNYNLSVENKITNLEFIYSAHPNRFTITKQINDNSQLLIIQNASPLFVSQALFYPENKDPIYPYTIYISLICTYSGNDRINVLKDCLQSLKSYLSLTFENKEIKGLEKAPFKFNDFPIPDTTIELVSERALNFIKSIIYMSPRIANDTLINPIISNIILLFSNTNIKFSNKIHELLQEINMMQGKIKASTGESTNNYRIPKYKLISIHFRKDNNTLDKLIYNLSISETTICEHLNFYHFILYMNVTAEDVIALLTKKNRTINLPQSIQNILEEEKRIRDLIVSQIVQPDKEMMTTAFYRWVEIGEKALESYNLFLYCSIYEGFNDTRITAPINENIKEGDKYKEIYKKRKDALFDDTVNTTHSIFKNSTSALKIPDFTIETMFAGLFCNSDKTLAQSKNIFNDLAQRYFDRIKLTNKKYKYQVLDDMLPMEFFRTVANEAVVFLSGQNSEPEFQISEELFSAIKKAF